MRKEKDSVRFPEGRGLCFGGAGGGVLVQEVNVRHRRKVLVRGAAGQEDDVGRNPNVVSSRQD